MTDTVSQSAQGEESALSITGYHSYTVRLTFLHKSLLNKSC